MRCETTDPGPGSGERLHVAQTRSDRSNGRYRSWRHGRRRSSRAIGRGRRSWSHRPSFHRVHDRSWTRSGPSASSHSPEFRSRSSKEPAKGIKGLPFVEALIGKLIQEPLSRRGLGRELTANFPYVSSRSTADDLIEEGDRGTPCQVRSHGRSLYGPRLRDC